ncbi:unnamed protein product [Allacma fusca]|uniref:Uncharacterized protein n=1 Tax=Allacma fusca TaxID=39272 RepID=A0A8J2LST7_9HEXA|nr:unnamed protein product [Allacma fusca]
MKRASDYSISSVSDRHFRRLVTKESESIFRRINQVTTCESDHSQQISVPPTNDSLLIHNGPVDPVDTVNSENINIYNLVPSTETSTDNSSDEI